jgi:hypothetical protein
MAQLVAHLLCKQGVRGSSPLGSTYFPLSSLLSALAGDSELRALAAINCSSWPSALIASVVLQFGLLARTRALSFRDFYPLAGAQSDQVGFEFSHHRRHVEQQPPRRVDTVLRPLKIRPLRALQFEKS